MSAGPQEPPTLATRRERPYVIVILISLAVGLLIGVIFRALKLPVPVPHDVAGVVGLVGMFVGAWLADLIATRLSSGG